MKHALSAALLIALASTAAVAQQRPSPPPQSGHADMKGPGGEGRHGPGPMRSPEKMFDMIDTNHDGTITRAEFASAHQRMAEQRKQRREGFGGQPPKDGQPRR